MDVELARPDMLSLDGLLSVLAWTLAGVGAYLLFTSVGTQEGLAGWALLFVALVLYLPRLFLRLHLEPEAVVVRVVSGTRRFPYEQLGEASLVDGLLLVRLFGVGAAGYHTGRYLLKGQGQVQAYATRFHGPFVMIDRGEKRPLILSPADPQAFVEAYEQRRPSPA